MKLKITIYPPGETGTNRPILKSRIEQDNTEIITQTDDLYLSRGHSDETPGQVKALVGLENKIIDLVKDYFNDAD